MDLVGDIGGTHTRLALARDGLLVDDTWASFTNADFPDPESLIATFLQGAPVIRRLCIAAAGPVAGQSLTLTNYPWVLERMRLAALTGGAQVTLVNDMQGQGHGLCAVQKPHRHLAGPAQMQSDRALIINIGTGLNAAVVHDFDGRTFVPPSEAGHMYLGGEKNAVLAEDQASGRALAAGKSQSDLAAALALFLHDVALVHLPDSGIYLTGGVAQALSGRIDWAALHHAMVGHGPYQTQLSAMGLFLVTDDRIALRGTARIAAGMTA